MGFPPQGAPPSMPPGPRPMMPGMPPVPMEQPGEDEPPNKRARTEDNLIPESDFLQRHSVRTF